jgi:hypothetical protein
MVGFVVTLILLPLVFWTEVGFGGEAHIPLLSTLLATTFLSFTHTGVLPRLIALHFWGLLLSGVVNAIPALLLVALLSLWVVGRVVFGNSRLYSHPAYTVVALLVCAASPLLLYQVLAVPVWWQWALWCPAVLMLLWWVVAQLERNPLRHRS